MPGIAIRAENLSKRYRIGVRDEMHETLGGAIADFVTRPAKNFRRLRRLSRFNENGRDPEDIIWALNDVSFEVNAGEVVGIIGRNGAGKSTLLKILTRITEPTEGYAWINGRVGSLLEVGTGFHPELTGRENVYLNGAVLGMRRKEIGRKFDEIVGFSGVERFIDTPVKRYSSGMKVRLAFAVAAHLEPEILVVDEVLAVGDAEFQKKCLGKMGDVTKEGRTVLFVSHNMAAIEHLCERVIVLESGRIEVDTRPEAAIADYLSIFYSASDGNNLASTKRSANLTPVIQRLEMLDRNGQPVATVPAGDPLTVHIHYMHSEPLKNPYFGLAFETTMGTRVFWVQSRMQKGALPDLPPSGIVACHIPRVPLVPGTYLISPGCGSGMGQLDFISHARQLQVTEIDVFGTGRIPSPSEALVLVDADWEIIHEAHDATGQPYAT